MVSENENVVPKRSKMHKDEEDEDVKHIQTIPTPNISAIKNKQRRTELYREIKRQKRKVSAILVFRTFINL